MSDDFGSRGRGRGVPLSELDPALTEVSRKVIGCAIEVHKAVGPGYDDGVYTEALKIALDGEGVSYQTDKSFDVEYEGKKVGSVTADLYVDDKFIVEVMARPGEVGTPERTALRAQLRAADVELGLVINFAERRLKDGLVRVLNPDKISSLRGDDDHHDSDD